MSRAVVVTGLGSVGAWGWGREALAAALAGSRVALSEVDRSAGYHRAGRPAGARRAALVPPGGLAEWVPPAEARRMSPPSKLALAAARMALADAGLSRRPGAPRGEGGEGLATAVALATAFGPSSFTEGLLRQILLEEPEAASPYLFTESVANAPAAQIAIATGARGAGLTVCQREAGPLIAVGRAAEEVASGRADLALAGAVEEMTPLLHAVLDRFGALARPGPGGEDERARPLDRHRDGFVAGEGATVLTLESEESARARGARPLARLLAWGGAFDATAPASGWGRGEAALGRSLARGLARASAAPSAVGDLRDKIDCIVSGASGSRAGDRVEALALRAAWQGEPLPLLLAPKGVTGEYGGGALGAAVLAAAGAPFGPTAGFAEPDPELGVVPHDGRPLPPPRRTLATAFAAGGAAAWLLLGAPGEPQEYPEDIA